MKFLGESKEPQALISDQTSKNKFYAYTKNAEAYYYTNQLATIRHLKPASLNYTNY